MQKKLLKIVFILFITLFVLGVNVYATNESIGDLITGSSVANEVNDPIVGDNSNSVESVTGSEEEEITNSDDENVIGDEEALESVGSTANDIESGEDENTTSNTITNNTTRSASSSYGTQTTQPQKTYSQVTNIPEANLSLNNILNVILIAVGVILILLAIAILIRLK